MQSSNKSFAGDLDRLIFFGSVAGIISLCVPLALFPEQGGIIPVSYTHLTLPTSYPV